MFVSDYFAVIEWIREKKKSEGRSSRLLSVICSVVLECIQYPQTPHHLSLSCNLPPQLVENEEKVVLKDIENISDLPMFS